MSNVLLRAVLIVSVATFFADTEASGGLISSSVSGSPSADGWVFQGNSLENGVYVRGAANYGWDAYGATFDLDGASNLLIADGDYSWLAGDRVLGIGGHFADITAQDAGWGAFTGNPVNSLLTQTHGPKLIAKFGTSDATFSASTVAPGSGNGQGSTSAGGDGTVFVRSSGWFHATDPLESQDTDTTWFDSSGQIMLLDKPNHISRVGTSTPDTRVARLIWIYDDVNFNPGKPASWQLLLNTSLLDRTAPVGFTGLTPGLGDSAIVSVQDRDFAFTDSLVRTVPEPTSLALLVLGATVLLRRRR